MIASSRSAVKQISLTFASAHRERRHSLQRVALSATLLLVSAMMPRTIAQGRQKALEPRSPVATATPTNAAPLHSEQASSAAAFVDSVGVQTHMSYLDTPYGNWPRVMTELEALGVHHIRDALPLNPAYIKGHQQLAAAGIHCTCGFGFDKEISAQEIIRAARAATDVEALEAPNECDAGTNCGGGGKTGIARVHAILPALAEAGHALNVPVIGPSFTTAEAYAATGPIAQWISDSNLHVYFGGRNPGTEGWGGGDGRGHRYGSLDFWADQSASNASGVPNVITETGYESFDKPSRPGTIPTDVESSYLLRTLLVAWSHGIRRTFIYELLDEFPDSGYGLLRHDLSEKPAFTALKNLLSILRDTSPGRSQSRLDLSIDTRDPCASHVLFEKGDGSYYLVLWLERSSFDAASLQRIGVPTQKVQLHLQHGYAATQVIAFNADGSTQTRKAAASSDSIALDLNDRLQVVRIDPL